MRVKKFDLSDLGTQLDNKMEEFKSDLRQDAKDREDRYNALMDRLAQDAREREGRLAQDAREREERLMQDAREREQRAHAMEERHLADRREFRSQKRWLIANFVGVVAIMFGFFLAVIGFVVAVANGNLSL